VGVIRSRHDRNADVALAKVIELNEPVPSACAVRLHLTKSDSQNQTCAIVVWGRRTLADVHTSGISGNTIGAIRSGSCEELKSSPGLFILNGSGQGQGAILNQDCTVTGPANLARNIHFRVTAGGSRVYDIHDKLHMLAKFRPLLVPEYDNRQAAAAKVLLVVEVFVGRQEEIKPRFFGGGQQVAIF